MKVASQSQLGECSLGSRNKGSFEIIAVAPNLK